MDEDKEEEEEEEEVVGELDRPLPGEVALVLGEEEQSLTML